MLTTQPSKPPGSGNPSSSQEDKVLRDANLAFFFFFNSWLFPDIHLPFSLTGVMKMKVKLLSRARLFTTP